MNRGVMQCRSYEIPMMRIRVMKCIMRSRATILSYILLPVQGVVLEGPVLKKVTNIFYALGIFNVVRWIFLIGSLAVLAYGLYLYYSNKKSVSITPIHGYEEKKDSEITRSTNVLIENLRNIDASRIGHTNPVLSGHEFDKYNI